MSRSIPILLMTLMVSAGCVGSPAYRPSNEEVANCVRQNWDGYKDRWLAEIPADQRQKLSLTDVEDVLCDHGDGSSYCSFIVRTRFPDRRVLMSRAADMFLWTDYGLMPDDIILIHERRPNSADVIAR